jgi:hypothetical protein
LHRLITRRLFLLSARRRNPQRELASNLDEQLRARRSSKRTMRTMKKRRTMKISKKRRSPKPR